MVSTTITESEVREALRDVKDPEIPVLSVIEMNIITSVRVEGSSAFVEVTPTFSGCPAMEMIRQDIASRLQSMGFEHVEVKKNLHKSWSTDSLSDATREKLRAFGIAPPSVSVHIELNVPCPYCRSSRTRLESAFGSTLCKQLYYCDQCRQSFERFKRL